MLSTQAQGNLILYRRFSPSDFELGACVLAIVISCTGFAFSFYLSDPLLIAVSTLAVISSGYSTYDGLKVRFFNGETVAVISPDGVMDAARAFSSWDAIESAKFVQGEFWLMGHDRDEPVLKLDRSTIGDTQFRDALELIQDFVPCETLPGTNR